MTTVVAACFLRGSVTHSLIDGLHPQGKTTEYKSSPLSMSFSFPPEIEDGIFELAARLRPYHRADAWLPLVSKRVQAR